MKTTIPIKSVMRDCTLNITVSGLKRLRVRLAIGAWLIALGVKVIGCKLNYNLDTEDKCKSTE